MNKETNARGNYKNRLIRRIAVQYMLTLLGFIAVFFFFLFMAYSISISLIWQPENPIYQILHFIKEYIIIFMGISLIAGWAVITYRFMGRPLWYLDEVISASETLAHPKDEQIILPDAMKNVQDRLNHVRETALLNAKLAKEAEQRKNDLIVYLAHDLKTPLTSVIGYLTLLRDESQISEELRTKYLSIALEKAERLEDLINEFFEITRFNLSGITLQYSKVNLTRMLEQLIFEFQPILAEKNLTCSLTILPNLMLKCDVNRMQRVFDNLLRNAYFYSFEDSTIEIIVHQNEQETVLLFKNQGDTIPQEKLARIFEQFYRLDTSRSSKSGGAGLGLAISKEIVELHSGTITAESEKDQIEFKITIPAA